MKDGAPPIATDGSGLRVAVVAASWHEQVMGGLLDGARAASPTRVSTTSRSSACPGTFELPVACSALADRFDAPRRARGRHPRRHPHFDYVCQAATLGITEVAVRTRVPDRLRRAHLRRRGSRPSTGPDCPARPRTRGTRLPRRSGHRRRAPWRGGVGGVSSRGRGRADGGAGGTGPASPSERHTDRGDRPVGWVTVKSFEQLYAELAEKAATRPEGSGTVAQLDAGVHAIGKKIVEEAAEVWMAAEYESNARAAEEISQLLYHLQVLMLAKGITLDDVYAHL